MHEVVNPFDLKPIGIVPTHDWDAVDGALARAHRLARDRTQWKKPHQRAAILQRAMGIMKERRDHLAFQIANEGGKPLIDARVEVDRAINGMELCIHEIGSLRGTEIPMGLTAAGDGRLAWTTREPIGVVVAVSAFNHPLNLIVHQVAPAVATGCPVIVKPSADTPLSCFEFIAILHEAGLEPDWAQAVQPPRDVSERMVSDSRVAFFSFIGSAGVGWSLRSKLAPGARCALEHGGVAPVIVDPSANLDLAVPSIVKGGFYHSGQVCVSVQRVFAHASIVDELATRMAEAAAKLKVGNAILEDTECGPLIRPKKSSASPNGSRKPARAVLRCWAAARNCRTPLTRRPCCWVRRSMRRSRATKSSDPPSVSMATPMSTPRLPRPIRLMSRFRRRSSPMIWETRCTPIAISMPRR